MSNQNTSGESVLIVGAGIFGASTAYHLSLSHPDPTKITVIDRTPFPPAPAASTDINKIIRTDYTSPFYMDLAYEAMEAWLTLPCLQNEAGERYFHHSGWIALNSTGSDMDSRIGTNFKQRGSDPREDVSLNEDLRSRWQGLLKEADFQPFDSGYWNPLPGWVDASDATAAVMAEAVSKGVKYVTGDAEGLLLEDNKVKGVKTADGSTHTADKILLATGAWTSSLLTKTEDHLNLPEEDRIERQIQAAAVCVAHFDLNEAETAELESAPVLIYGVRGEVLPPSKRKRVLKFTNATSFTNTVTTATGHKISAPPSQDQSVVPAKLKQETLQNVVHRTIPRYTANRDVSFWRLCWESISPNQDWLVTKHPHSSLGNMYFAVGGSFHSYKFLPTAGKYVVNVLEGRGNGKEKDTHWMWKRGPVEGRGAHEKVVPKRELRDLEN